MIIKEIEIVINVDYGGFSLTEEMANWLAKNKNWQVAHNPKGKIDGFDLVGVHGSYYPGGKWKDREIEFRMSEDLIDCVKALQFYHADDDWKSKQENQLFCLY